MTAREFLSKAERDKIEKAKAIAYNFEKAKYKGKAEKENYERFKALLLEVKAWKR